MKNINSYLNEQLDNTSNSKHRMITKYTIAIKKAIGSNKTVKRDVEYLVAFLEDGKKTRYAIYVGDTFEVVESGITDLSINDIEKIRKGWEPVDEPVFGYNNDKYFDDTLFGKK